MQPDERLLALARTGHDGAFEAFVGRYRSPLESFCRRYLDAAQAEDVSQEAFFKLFEHVRSGVEIDHPRAWLYRVAKNAAINSASRKGANWDELDPERSAAPSTAQAVEGRERLNSLVEGIKELPAKQREAVVQHEFADVGFDQLVNTLGTSEQGAWQLLMRARRKLRDRVAVLFPLFLLRWILPTSGDAEVKRRIARSAATQTTSVVTKVAIGLAVTLGLVSIGLGLKEVGSDNGTVARGQAATKDSDSRLVADADRAETATENRATPPGLADQPPVPQDAGASSPQPVVAPGTDGTRHSPALRPGSVQNGPKAGNEGRKPSPETRDDSGSTQTSNGGGSNAVGQSNDGSEAGSGQSSGGGSGGSGGGSGGSGGGSGGSGGGSGGSGSGGSGSGGSGSGGSGGSSDGGSPQPPHQWAGAAALSAPGVDADNPDVAFMGNQTVAVWRAWDGTRNRVQAAVGQVSVAARTRDQSGSNVDFGTIETISGENHQVSTAGPPQVAISETGRIYVVWTEQGETLSSYYKVYMSIREPNGSFSAPQRLSTNARSAFQPRVEALDDGGAIIAWYRSTSTSARQVVESVKVAPNGDVGETNSFDDRTGSIADLQLVANGRGDALVIWRIWEDSIARVAGMSSLAGSNVWTSRYFSGRAQFAVKTSAAVNESGAMAVTWTESDGTNVSTYTSVRWSTSDFEFSWSMSPTWNEQTAWEARAATATDIDSNNRVATLWRSIGDSVPKPGGGSYRQYPLGYAERAPDTAISNPEELLADAGDPEMRGAPAVAFDDENNLVIVLAGFDRERGVGVIQSMVRLADGTMTAPRTISSDGCTNPYAPQTALDDDGNVMAVWECRTNSTSSVEASIAG